MCEREKASLAEGIKKERESLYFVATEDLNVWTMYDICIERVVYQSFRPSSLFWNQINLVLVTSNYPSDLHS